MAKAGQNWSRDEIEAVIADYLEMLRLEQSGTPYNKSAHRRRLMRSIDRSKGSVEYKHQNISAALERFGIPFIAGYKPARNFQQALSDVIGAMLQRDQQLHGLLTGERIEAGPDTGALIEFDDEPPAIGEFINPEGLDQEVWNSVISSYGDPAERDARNRKLGKAGESRVVAHEKQRLSLLGRDDLAEKVRWVAALDGDGHGYDIRSYKGEGEEAGQERLLEVKSTTGGRTVPFFLTRNEFETGERHIGTYRIVRLYNFNIRRRAYRVRPPLSDNLDLTPISFRALPSGQKETVPR
ncbi:MAG: DUF3883 domain-containing protein [Rhodobacteraceae bacterium]|nr:DUF3883 domain-containing protein [Paracoccaceae bacterium]